MILQSSTLIIKNGCISNDHHEPEHQNGQGCQRTGRADFLRTRTEQTSAINMFLRAVIRENGIPFSPKLGAPNRTTAAAIKDGRRIASDSNVKGYTGMDDLKDALGVDA